MNEFDIIDTYFKTTNTRKDVLLGIGDDCAVLHPPPNKKLLVSIDTLQEGSHFFPDTDPFDIGYKSVAVGLSDLAAMGADPAFILLALTLPNPNPTWLEAFSKGFFACANAYGLALVGGNTCKGNLSITTQIMGFTQHKYLTRSGAKPGDLIYVTGTLGDGGLALALLENKSSRKLFSSDEIKTITHRLWHPHPRIAEGKMLSKIAHAAIDISDGLIADLKHILTQSQVGATIYVDKLPLSTHLEKIDTKMAIKFALSAGDDYELCLTLPPDKINILQAQAQKYACQFTCIGEIDSTKELKLIDSKGRFLNLEQEGYKHF